ncbi:hypothetical protein GQ457_03G003810 [Hibiscus cannabinus]
MLRIFFVALCVVAVAVVVFSSETRMTEAAVCDLLQLDPCTPALVSVAPSAECCSKLKEQQPCLCEQLKNSAFGQFVKSPNAKKVAAICNRISFVALCAVALAVVLFFGETQMAEAAVCDPKQLARDGGSIGRLLRQAEGAAAMPLWVH